MIFACSSSLIARLSLKREHQWLVASSVAFVSAKSVDCMDAEIVPNCLMKKAKKHTPVSTLLYAAFFIATLALQARGGQEVQEVIVVYKTHFDIGYTDLVTNVLTRYRTKFVDGAMQAIEHSRSLPQGEQFVWTIPGWPLKQMLWPGQTPDRREKILKAVVR